jgi:signal transduction histidine kinase/CheY-like chemotaxis protein
MVMELNLAIFEKAQAREEYFMYREERSKEQWIIMHKKIGRILERMAEIFEEPEEEAPLNNVTGIHKKMGVLFDQLVKLDESVAVHTDTTQAFRERMISQMLVSAYAQYREGLKLLKTVNEKTIYQHNLSRLYSNIAFGLMTLVIVFLALIIIRSITSPLSKLHEGAEIVAGGNLDHKINLGTSNEIGRLSEAFDNMTENLKKITVSRDDLSKEIERRKEAEARLITSLADLERSNRKLEQEITERKRMEDELIKAQKLESVGILAGGIAHDFNNILTSVSGNISLAKMRIKPGDKIFDLLSAAEAASMRAQGLTRQLLTFAKGGAPVKEIASLQNLIKESSLYVLTGSKSRCEFQIAEDLWPVEVDVGQINQVIRNVVLNANQAMPDGGIIRVTGENHVLDEKQDLPVKPGRYIRISIKDQGVGIAEKHLSKIFDPFFSTKPTGRGLGLATAYSIIKKHNGHIAVNSLPEAGATFHIYLPASDKELPVKEEPVLLTGSGRILIMDDDKLLKEMAGDMLEMLGYESGFADDGDEAIEMYKKAMGSEKPYDAVILDLTIPGGMGGKETIKKLLEIDPEIKAVVFSGYSDDPVMSNYRKYGFKGMMPKPFDAYALGKALSDVLSSRA